MDDIFAHNLLSEFARLWQKLNLRMTFGLEMEFVIYGKNATDKTVRACHADMRQAIEQADISLWEEEGGGQGGDQGGRLPCCHYDTSHLDFYSLFFEFSSDTQSAEDLLKTEVKIKSLLQRCAELHSLEVTFQDTPDFRHLCDGGYWSCYSSENLITQTVGSHIHFGMKDLEDNNALTATSPYITEYEFNEIAHHVVESILVALDEGGIALILPAEDQYKRALSRWQQVSFKGGGLINESDKDASGKNYENSHFECALPGGQSDLLTSLVVIQLGALHGVSTVLGLDSLIKSVSAEYADDPIGRRLTVFSDAINQENLEQLDLLKTKPWFYGDVPPAPPTHNATSKVEQESSIFFRFNFASWFRKRESIAPPEISEETKKAYYTIRNKYEITKSAFPQNAVEAKSKLQNSPFYKGFWGLDF